MDRSTETAAVGVLQSVLANPRQAAVGDLSTETAAVNVLESVLGSWMVELS